MLLVQANVLLVIHWLHLKYRNCWVFLYGKKSEDQFECVKSRNLMSSEDADATRWTEAAAGPPIRQKNLGPWVLLCVWLGLFLWSDPEPLGHLLASDEKFLNVVKSWKAEEAWLKVNGSCFLGWRDTPTDWC